MRLVLSAWRHLTAKFLCVVVSTLLFEMADRSSLDVNHRATNAVPTISQPNCVLRKPVSGIRF
jgi:hypothetical protein